ncbi:uncharacterized protein [Euwallacea similis]|uniref:uncharacterized protein isoform X1 n=1 Tax=Euwallacea similis TaxID=1736056 RepID=UPI00344CFDDA
MNNGDKIKENDEPKDIEILTFLPLASSIQLEQVELFLKENSKNLSILASELSRIGGNNVSVITKRIMYRTFSNYIGQFFSWDGAKGKQPFKELLLAQVIIRAVRLNTATASASEHEIVNAIKGWLLKAKARHENYLKKNNQDKQKDMEGTEVEGELEATGD